MNKEQIISSLDAFEEFTRDEAITIEQLRFVESSDCFTVTGQSCKDLTVSGWAEGQLLGKLKIPGAYFHRCPPYLKSVNFNHWALHPDFKGKQVRLRYYQDVVRGIVSTKRFNLSMDDKYVVPTILEILENRSLELIGAKPTGDHTFIKGSEFTFWSIPFELEAIHNGVRAQAGVLITNSEVGLSCLHIRPCLFIGYRPIYAHGATSLYHSNSLAHEKVFEGLEKSLASAQGAITNYFVRGSVEVNNPWNQIEKLVERNDELPVSILDFLSEGWKERAHATKIEIAEAILDSVKELPLYRQYKATEVVGQYLCIFDTIKTTTASIIEELSATGNLEED